MRSASWRPAQRMVTPLQADTASRPAGSHNGGSDSEGEAGAGRLIRWKAWLGVHSWTGEHDRLTREDELVLHVSGIEAVCARLKQLMGNLMRSKWVGLRAKAVAVLLGADKSGVLLSDDVWPAK